MKKQKLLILGGILTLAIGSLLIIYLPYAFTNYSSGITFNNQDSIIGETIGGITAPVASIVGSTLVFLALVAQVKANERIQNQIDAANTQRTEDKEIEELHKKYNYLNDEISKFQLFTKSEKHVHKSYSGIYALFGYAEVLKDGYGVDSHKDLFIKTNVNHSNIYNLLSLFLLTVQDTLESNLQPERKIYFIKLASHINASKIYPPFAVRLDQCIQADQMNETHLRCSDCGKYHHTVPGIIYERLVRIDKKIREALEFYKSKRS
jgi:hypothetical protein